MSKLPAFQFYPGDWLKDPAVSMCSPSTRGIWIDLLCVLHELGRSGQVTGTPDQLCRSCRCTPTEFTRAIEELNATGAANIHERNGVVTVINRRMQREHRERVITAERVRKHRSNGAVTVVKRNRNGPSSSSSSTSKKKKKEGAATSSQPPPISSAIKFVQSLTNRFPDKSLWSKIEEFLGSEFSEERLRECYLEWISRGFNKMNYAWLFEWYPNGIPPKNGGNGKDSHGTHQPRRFETKQELNDRITKKNLSLLGHIEPRGEQGGEAKALPGYIDIDPEGESRVQSGADGPGE